MTTENLKNWLKTQTDCGEGITLGGIDANRGTCLGVLPRANPAPSRLCLGGPSQTRCQALYATVLVHWGRDAALAEAKAREIWALFYGAANFAMDGAPVILCDPGQTPRPRKRDARGICEFEIELAVWYAAPPQKESKEENTWQ